MKFQVPIQHILYKYHCHFHAYMRNISIWGNLNHRLSWHGINPPPLFFLSVYTFIFNNISLLFHFFLPYLTCSCPYPYNLIYLNSNLHMSTLYKNYPKQLQLRDLEFLHMFAMHFFLSILHPHFPIIVSYNDDLW